MNTYLLDARALGEDTLHDYLTQVLPLPEYYGRNLDALFDCLTELDETRLMIARTEEAPPDFDRVRRVLLDAAEENPNLTVVFSPGETPDDR